MFKIINNQSYNDLRIELIGGNVTGLWEKNNFFIGSNSYPIMKYPYKTANFNDFEKNHNPNKTEKVSYHLSGYGLLYNESNGGFIGESIERYSFSMLPAYIKNNVIIECYNNLLSKENITALPLEYINIFHNKESEKHYVKKTDEIKWAVLPSLIDSTKKIAIPLQFVVMYSSYLFNEEKHYGNSAVSTGTACHEDDKKSIEAAIIEYLQIDSFNLWWYAGLKETEIEIDIGKKLATWFNNQPSTCDFLDKFTVSFYDISFDKPINVILCEITSKDKNCPKYVVGVQGGYNKENCIYRSFMECLTVVEFAFNISWIDQSKYTSIEKGDKIFSNLDDNVIYYSKFGKNENIKRVNTSYKEIGKVSNLNELMNVLSCFTKYAVGLNITPNEFSNLNTQVFRVIIPELLPMCLPSFPPI